MNDFAHATPDDDSLLGPAVSPRSARRPPPVELSEPLAPFAVRPAPAVPTPAPTAAPIPKWQPEPTVGTPEPTSGLTPERQPEPSPVPEPEPGADVEVDDLPWLALDEPIAAEAWMEPGEEPTAALQQAGSDPSLEVAEPWVSTPGDEAALEPQDDVVFGGSDAPDDVEPGASEVAAVHAAPEAPGESDEMAPAPWAAVGAHSSLPGDTTDAPAFGSVAERLEAMARTLRQGGAAELLEQAGEDPFRLLVAGYALGFAEASRRGPVASTDT